MSQIAEKLGNDGHACRHGVGAIGGARLRPFDAANNEIRTLIYDWGLSDPASMRPMCKRAPLRVPFTLAGLTRHSLFG